MGRRRWNRAASALIIACTSGTAVAAEILVGPGESIQDAITIANDGDVITVAPGFYFENLDLLGKAITLQSDPDPMIGGADTTYLGQRGLDSVIRCVRGEGRGTIIDGFTIWLGAAFEGGGLLVIDSGPTVMNCTFRQNNALHAGGAISARACDPGFPELLCAPSPASMPPPPSIVGTETGPRPPRPSLRRLLGDPPPVAPGSSPMIIDCVFEQNTVTSGPGGAIYNDAASTSEVIHCEFRQNTATSGGGIYNDGGSPLIDGCTISNGNASRGGGFFGNGGSPVVNACTFRNNFVSVLGGAVYLQGGGDQRIVNCTIGANFADQGGGIFVSGTAAEIAGCLITGNQATAVGGGAYTFDSDAMFVNCTFSQNSATEGGPAFQNLAGAPTIVNSIIWGHTSKATPNGIGGAVSMITIDRSDIEGGWTGSGSGNIEVDPLFADADGLDEFAGNEDDDLRPLAGSPTIDSGDSSRVPVYLDVDIAQNLRLKETCSPNAIEPPPMGLEPVDMGAYEATFGSSPQAVMFVAAGADPDGCGSCWSDALDEVRKALEIAATSGGMVQEIWVAEGTYRPTTDDNRTKSFTLMNNLALYGGFPPPGAPVDCGDPDFLARDLRAHPTVLSGALGVFEGENVHSFHVVNGAGTAEEPTDATAIIDGFVISDGRADDENAANFDGRRGAGMLIGAGAPTVSDCFFRDNIAADSGGALFIGPVTLRITNCAFQGNSANANDAANGGGGAIYADSGSELTLGNCTLYQNTATNGSGGGLFSFLGATVIENCILYGNVADTDSQLAALGSPPAVSYTNIDQAGIIGLENLIGMDPGFVDGPGGDLRLAATSVCIGAGNNALVGPDTADVDDDGDVTETIPRDLDARPRIIETVDMGPYEFHPTGACCMLDGSCSALSAFDCAAVSGTYQGDDVTCASVTCPQPGGCCFPDGSCTFVLATVCAAEGGAFAGQGVSCVDAACPQPFACGGDLDGSGDIGFGDVLAVIRMWGPCSGCLADLDGDGTVDFSDVLVLLGHWGSCS